MVIAENRLVLGACSLLVAMALLIGGAGNALAYKRDTTVTGSDGKTATQNVDANRTATGYNRTATTTGPNGKSVDSQSSGNYDKATKTWTKKKAVTGPNGQTKSYEKDTTITK